MDSRQTAEVDSGPRVAPGRVDRERPGSGASGCSRPHVLSVSSPDLTLCLGIESLITLQDVRCLGPEDAIEICRWAAHAMLEAALVEQDSAPSKSRKASEKPRNATSRR